MVDAARLRRARNRSQTGRTLLEGSHLLSAAQAAGAEIESIFSIEEMEGSTLVTTEILEKISDTQSPQGPIAVMAVPSYQAITSGNVVVLDQVSDPGNLGTVIRSAAAFGFGVVVAGGADPWSPKVLRSGAGAHFLTPIERLSSVTPGDLRTRGFLSVGSVVRGGLASFEDLNFTPTDNAQVALWVGNESHGLGPDVVRNLDALISVPMPGLTESLNAAVAASILMFLWSEIEDRSGR